MNRRSVLRLYAIAGIGLVLPEARAAAEAAATSREIARCAAYGLASSALSFAATVTA